MSRTIAVDYDGCLILYKQLMISQPNELLFKKLIGLREGGDKIILWTCREGEKLKEAIEACKKFGLEFDAVNKNVKDWGEEAKHKIRADLYIDNLAVHQDDFILKGR